MGNIDKSDDRRSKYDRLILKKEREIDDLANDRKIIEDNLDKLNEDIYRGYQQLSMINEGDLVSDNIEIIRLQQMNDEQEQMFRHWIKGHEENVLDSYTQENKKLERETEDLYEKRREIPWD